MAALVSSRNNRQHQKRCSDTRWSNAHILKDPCLKINGQCLEVCKVLSFQRNDYMIKSYSNTSEHFISVVVGESNSEVNNFYPLFQVSNNPSF